MVCCSGFSSVSKPVFLYALPEGPVGVTKLDRPQTYREAGRERASGAAGRSTRQAGASTERRHWQWTQMESRASSEQEQAYNLGSDHADVGRGGAHRFFSIATQVNGYRSSIVTTTIHLLSSSGLRRYKKGFVNTAVDLTESVKVEGEATHQSSLDQTYGSLLNRLSSRDSRGSAGATRRHVVSGHCYPMHTMQQ